MLSLGEKSEETCSLEQQHRPLYNLEEAPQTS